LRISLFSPQEFFELGLIILNISEEQALAEFINTFTEPVNPLTTPLQQFIKDLKEYNDDDIIETLNLTISENTTLKSIL